MTPRLCFVALSHEDDEYLADLVGGLRRFCPEADVVWYDSGRAVNGERRNDSGRAGVPRLPVSRPLDYAKVTPFFLDMFEWAAEQPYELVVNLESDMAFIRPGFGSFLAQVMQNLDYLAPAFGRATPQTSKWRPYRSLRSELPELFGILGVQSTNQCFSPGQVFSRRYIETLLASPIYPEVRKFVERNQLPDRSFSLQEVLLPTVADALDLAVDAYPAEATRFNRYRPYHASKSVKTATTRPNVYFVHPVRRDHHHPARQLVRALAQGEEGV